jgi:hypothetical protein
MILKETEEAMLRIQGADKLQQARLTELLQTE